VLLLTQRYNEADQEIEEGLKRQPNSAFGHFPAGIDVLTHQPSELAERSLRTALQVDPKMSQGVSRQLVNRICSRSARRSISELQSYVRAFPDTPFAPQARTCSSGCKEMNPVVRSEQAPNLPVIDLSYAMSLICGGVHPLSRGQ